MKVIMVNPPFRYNNSEWITVPPQGYGGIQWIIKNISDGLLELGHDVIILGAPNSPSNHPNLTIPSVGDESEISQYLLSIDKDVIIHDHTSRGIEFSQTINWNNRNPIIHSHYLTSRPLEKKNLVAASYAHANVIGYPGIPVIRHSVNPLNYRYSESKERYLLYLGRISNWKGVHIAAQFAQLAGYKLIMAGPSWEKDYYQMLLDRFGSVIEYVGEVGGEDKLKLLSKATATLVFSGGLHEPTGLKWTEPGSQVVSESAISGTPVISSDNGCLSEIVPLVGHVIKETDRLNESIVEHVLSSLPKPCEVHTTCLKEWGYLTIAKQYEGLYRKVSGGGAW